MNQKRQSTVTTSHTNVSPQLPTLSFTEDKDKNNNNCFYNLICRCCDNDIMTNRNNDLAGFDFTLIKSTSLSIDDIGGLDTGP